MAAFADYDLDGDLDMYLLTNRYVPPNGRPATPPVIIADGRGTILPEYQNYYEFKPNGSLDDRAGLAGCPYFATTATAPLPMSRPRAACGTVSRSLGHLVGLQRGRPARYLRRQRFQRPRSTLSQQWRRQIHRRGPRRAAAHALVSRWEATLPISKAMARSTSSWPTCRARATFAG